MLIGAKADLARETGPADPDGGGESEGDSQREVGYEEALAWASERCMSYVEVSAKTEANVNAALLTMVAEIAEAATALHADASGEQ